MTEPGSGEHVAEAFEAQRPRLVAVAYRMLGSRADAEDAVQEAWLRLARQDEAAIDNLAGWLTTVVGRVCLDVLRSRRSRRETPVGGDLPELVVTEDDGDPASEAELADSVGLALLVVLDTLGPAERLAFVLHDMFAMPFEEIATVLGRSTAATKMLASRARRKLQGSPSPADDRRRQRAVVDAFLAAARDGDFDGLVRVLHPDVVWRTHAPSGEVVVRRGSAALARAVSRGAGLGVTARRVLVNGELGVMAWDAAGQPLGVMACTVAGGRIVEVLAVSGRRRLEALDVPRP
ncbi:RNA polymerase, sigma-24 subunit, ECF subfamily [Beutenbergia cavernae DSM 12333]|uniref:RNA polymerase, sigma-24 subunit, ECF subfamily n=1 Tax=Beutenbergia cavernae (strain ATCC BAA-8 / DSM 12333 / CCUG 43141 / JCM 11478 / NBRC 16432 / NCIMB 13614 / HKI 0122) TaxID=471853 RepID=C5C630_BEUC1|nr:sigma-70 family RNA polymerase sigma factor [Beutenbergia cavernae]ACQ82388.1 RNA polymerase, sigma-24 subunit, ECF subfamily [Beutenbergia cavernae DSM 12333]